MSSNEKKIATFWQWFVKNEKAIKECIELDSSPNQAYIVDQMNELILDLGVFTWDIGLDNTDQWFLTISPNGNSDYLSISQEIMLASPDHMLWTFHSSKPAQKWNRKFMIFTEDMEEAHIDASGWSYIALREEDNTLEIILEATNIDQLDDHTAEEAANQFLLKELGEEVKIQRVSTFTIVTRLEAHYQPNKVSIEGLSADVDA